jgi:hypothetical protein
MCCICKIAIEWGFKKFTRTWRRGNASHRTRLVKINSEIQRRALRISSHTVAGALFPAPKRRARCAVPGPVDEPATFLDELVLRANKNQHLRVR